MRSKTIANGWLALVLAICSFAAVNAQPPRQGELQTFVVRGLEISFDDQSIDPADIRRLGSFLEQRQFADDERREMEVRKKSSGWQLLIVARDPDVVTEPKAIDWSRQFLHDISVQVFESANVEFHLLNKNQKTFLVISGKPVIGTLKLMSGMEVYVDLSVLSEFEAKRIADFVNPDGQEDGETIILTKRDETIVLQQFVNDTYRYNLAYFDWLSNLVKSVPEKLNGQKLIVELIDQEFNVLQTIPGWKGPPRRPPVDKYSVHSVDDVEIYFDEATVEEEDADRLAETLLSMGFSDGSFRLDRINDLWIIGVEAGLESVEEQKMVRSFSHVAAELSILVFEGATVEFHLIVDRELWRIAKAKSLLGDRFVTVNGCTIFFDQGPVSRVDARKLGNLLDLIGFSDGTPKSLRLSMDEGVWQISMVLNQDVDLEPDVTEAIRQLADMIAERAWPGEAVQFRLLDDSLKLRGTVSSSGSSLDN